MSYTKPMQKINLRKLRPALPGVSGCGGRRVDDNRRSIEGEICLDRNGGRWRSLTPDYGEGSSVHKRIKCWIDKGLWQMIFNIFAKDRDMEWVIGSTIVRLHPHEVGAKKGLKLKHLEALVGDCLPKFIRLAGAMGPLIRCILTGGEGFGLHPSFPLFEWCKG